MTDQQHPITPPPGLVDQWYRYSTLDNGVSIASQAARWGADQELEACCEWTTVWISTPEASQLRAARRPQLPPETLEVDGHTYRLVK